LCSLRRGGVAPRPPCAQAGIVLVVEGWRLPLVLAATKLVFVLVAEGGRLPPVPAAQKLVIVLVVKRGGGSPPSPPRPSWSPAPNSRSLVTNIDAEGGKGSPPAPAARALVVGTLRRVGGEPRPQRSKPGKCHQCGGGGSPSVPAVRALVVGIVAVGERGCPSTQPRRR
jgi:hypothetical protein